MIESIKALSYLASLDGYAPPISASSMDGNVEWKDLSIVTLNRMSLFRCCSNGFVLGVAVSSWSMSRIISLLGWFKSL